MPKKSNNSDSSEKGKKKSPSSRRSAGKKERQAIGELIDALPGAISKEQSTASFQTVDSSHPFLGYNTPAYKKKQQLLWLGVAVLSLGIVILWMTNVRLSFEKLAQTDTQFSGGVVGDAKSNFSDLVRSFDEVQQQAQEAAAILAEEVQQKAATTTVDLPPPTQTSSSIQQESDVNS
mgnify:CR=1 FL=1